MDQRSTGIVATVVTALLCGCSGLVCIFAGGITSLTSFIPDAEIDILGRTDPQAAFGAGIGMLCLGIVFVLIPVLVGIFTLRKKPQPVSPVIPPEEPLPPAL
jgi:hypothetical protein